jgi:hypothetical protein
MRFSCAIAFGIAALAACSEQQSPTALVASRNAPAVTTQPGFYFLPPVAPAAVYNGTFDGSLAPAVEVRDAANTLQARFTTSGSGANAVRVSLRDEHYIVNWQNRAGSASTVIVLLEGQELGRMVLEAGRRTWPIKFRIEQGVLPPPNYALQFNQTYVEVPDAPSLDLSRTWTIEAWVKPQSVGLGSYQHVVSKWNGGGNASYSMEIYQGRLGSGVHDGVRNSILHTTATLLDDVWQHVAATYDNGTMCLYINGVLDGCMSGCVTAMNSDRPVSIGHEGPPWGGWWYYGLVDEVRVWNVARTAAQLASGMGARLSGSENGLAGYWRFDEGQGDVAHDASPFGNHGRLGATVGSDAADPLWTTTAAPIQ